jgi:hypothetical protein
VLFDVTQGAIRKVVRSGAPWQLNHVVSREIVVTRTGKIYTYRGAEEAKWHDLENEVWVYDIATGEHKPTGQRLKGGFWNGQAQTRDRNTVYLSTVSGELYVLNVARETFSHLGYFLDAADADGASRYRVKYLYGISLTSAQDAVVGVPIIAATSASGARTFRSRLTSYSVAQRKFTALVDLDAAVLTGSDHRDGNGNLYMTAFDWDTNCRLAVLKPALANGGGSRAVEK